jgi:hypothetical protein
MKLVDEIVALLDRDGVSQLGTVMILTEVAGLRAFPDAVSVTLGCQRIEDIVPRARAWLKGPDYPRDRAALERVLAQAQARKQRAQKRGRAGP